MQPHRSKVPVEKPPPSEVEQLYSDAILAKERKQARREELLAEKKLADQTRGIVDTNTSSSKVYNKKTLSNDNPKQIMTKGDKEVILGKAKPIKKLVDQPCISNKEHIKYPETREHKQDNQSMKHQKEKKHKLEQDKVKEPKIKEQDNVEQKLLENKQKLLDKQKIIDKSKIQERIANKENYLIQEEKDPVQLKQIIHQVKTEEQINTLEQKQNELNNLKKIKDEQNQKELQNQQQLKSDQIQEDIHKQEQIQKQKELQQQILNQNVGELECRHMQHIQRDEQQYNEIQRQLQLQCNKSSQRIIPIVSSSGEITCYLEKRASSNRNIPQAHRVGSSGIIRALGSRINPSPTSMQFSLDESYKKASRKKSKTKSKSGSTKSIKIVSDKYGEFNSDKSSNNGSNQISEKGSEPRSTKSSKKASKILAEAIQSSNPLVTLDYPSEISIFENDFNMITTLNQHENCRKSPTIDSINNNVLYSDPFIENLCRSYQESSDSIIKSNHSIREDATPQQYVDIPTNLNSQTTENNTVVRFNDLKQTSPCNLLSSDIMNYPGNNDFSSFDSKGEVRFRDIDKSKQPDLNTRKQQMDQNFMECTEFKKTREDQDIDDPMQCRTLNDRITIQPDQVADPPDITRITGTAMLIPRRSSLDQHTIENTNSVNLENDSITGNSTDTFESTINQSEEEEGVDLKKPEILKPIDCVYVIERKTNDEIMLSYDANSRLRSTKSQPPNMPPAYTIRLGRPEVMLSSKRRPKYVMNPLVEPWRCLDVLRNTATGYSSQPRFRRQQPNAEANIKESVKSTKSSKKESKMAIPNSPRNNLSNFNRPSDGRYILIYETPNEIIVTDKKPKRNKSNRSKRSKKRNTSKQRTKSDTFTKTGVIDIVEKESKVSPSVETDHMSKNIKSCAQIQPYSISQDNNSNINQNELKNKSFCDDRTNVKTILQPCPQVSIETDENISDGKISNTFQNRKPCKLTRSFKTHNPIYQLTPNRLFGKAPSATGGGGYMVESRSWHEVCTPKLIVEPPKVVKEVIEEVVIPEEPPKPKEPPEIAPESLASVNSVNVETCQGDSCKMDELEDLANSVVVNILFLN